MSRGGAGRAASTVAPRMPAAGVTLPARTEGFSLIELAIVVAAMALIAGGLMGPLRAQMDLRQFKQMERDLVQIREALVGFAIANQGRLPCTDGSGDGLENPDDTANCPPLEGWLPSTSLGVGRRDPWGQRYRYRPDSAFASATAPPEPPDTVDGLRVIAAEDGRALTLGNPHGPVAIVYSCGRDRVSESAVVAVAEANSCGLPRSASTVYRLAENTAGLDDALTWLSKNILLARLTQAGQWPSLRGG